MSGLRASVPGQGHRGGRVKMQPVLVRSLVPAARVDRSPYPAGFHSIQCVVLVTRRAPIARPRPGLRGAPDQPACYVVSSIRQALRCLRCLSRGAILLPSDGAGITWDSRFLRRRGQAQRSRRKPCAHAPRLGKHLVVVAFACFLGVVGSDPSPKRVVLVFALVSCAESVVLARRASQ